MTAALRTLAFGTLETGGAWGALMAGADGEAVITLGAGDRGTLTAGGPLLSAEGDDAEWRLTGPLAELVVAPASEAVVTEVSEHELSGSDQLCRVSGWFRVDGTEHSFEECLGVRTWWSGPLSLERFGSVRAVSSWFEPDEAFAMTALRPRQARSHDGDVVAASVIVPEAALPVEDPRLSTTYDEQGWPIRAGLELWLAGEEPERQYPRRASGEAAGARVQARLGELEVRAEPFRWHSRDRDGAGVYLLARRP